jgi:hypothetical protein
MDKELLKKYRKIQTKFDLPQFSKLKKTFNFEIDKDDDLLSQIRHQMSDKVFSLSEKIIEPLLFGSDYSSQVFEQRMIDQKEVNELFELYKKVQILKWEENLLLIYPNEKDTTRWIKEAWKLWNENMEKKLLVLCKKLSKKWGSLELKGTETYYHV